MTVLVTGGAGYIGSHVVLALLAAGERVVVIDDLRTGFEDLLPPDVQLVRGDFGDRHILDQAFRSKPIDAVMHFAASTVVPDSIASPLTYYENNLVNTHALLEACVAHGINRFIFSSSASVYGAGSRAPITEGAALRPISPYGATKMMAERILQDTATAHDLSYAILRYFNVAGADPAGRTGQKTQGATHLIKIACEVATGHREQLTVFGSDYPTPDGTCVRDYVHVSDLASAHLRALDHLDSVQRSSIFNVGYGRGYSVLDVIAAVEAETGKSISMERAGRRMGDPPISVADSARIKKQLGWRPVHDDIKMIVRTALAFERSLG
jgi:UDP-glucose 4-epimerase